jgi:hypothetical protein
VQFNFQQSTSCGERSPIDTLFVRLSLALSCVSHTISYIKDLSSVDPRLVDIAT